MNNYTEANMETAMCLWEAALDLRDQSPTNVEAQDARMRLNRVWDDNGTVAMRHTLIAWVHECEAEWEAACEKGTELVPYDWEHCPDFLIRKINQVFV